MKWPFVRRSRLEAEQDRAKNAATALERARQYHNQYIDKMERQRAYEIEKVFEPAVNKICKIQIRQFDEPFPRWALQVEMESYWVQAALEHGNSEREIDSLADALAYRVKREICQAIKTRNMQRF